MDSEYIYPIKVVADKTGLTAYVIRAWEKRYSAIEPGRTDTNRRLYCEDDIQRLKLLSKLTKAGHSIGTIAKLPTTELQKLISEITIFANTKIPDEARNHSSYLLVGLKAIEDLDIKGLEEILSRATVDLSQPDLLQEVVIPMINSIGDNWKNGNIRIYHEHLASSVIKTFLSNLIGAVKVEQNAPNIIIATPMGQMHEMGALLAAAAAASEGWRATYLGPNLPAEEIAAAVQQIKPKAIALSLVYPPDDPKIDIELTKLANYMGNDTIIYVGGNSAESYNKTLSRIKAKVLFDLNEFRNELVKIRKNK
jgi:DNA-binding transcriptional MerR regulator/methylmalonyl-CoA mutase cobalamin-binding subunit